MLFKFFIISFSLIILVSCGDDYHTSKNIEGMKLTVEKTFFGNFEIKLISKSDGELKLAKVTKKSNFHINDKSNILAVIERYDSFSRIPAKLIVMKYNGNYKQLWSIRGSYSYYKEITDDTGKKEKKLMHESTYCDLSGLGWMNSNTLQLHVNCGYADNLYFGDTGESIGYLDSYKAGDYEIKFDIFNKITSLKYIDLKKEIKEKK